MTTMAGDHARAAVKSRIRSLALENQAALEAAGVEFIPADGEKGPGLRLKHKVRGKRVKQAGMRGKSA